MESVQSNTILRILTAVTDHHGRERLGAIPELPSHPPFSANEPTQLPFWGIREPISHD